MRGQHGSHADAEIGRILGLKGLQGVNLAVIDLRVKVEKTRLLHLGSTFVKDFGAPSC